MEERIPSRRPPMVVTLRNCDEVASCESSYANNNGHAAKQQSAKLKELMSQLQCGELDEAVEAIDSRRRNLAWARLPNRIVLLRHGESEGNVNHMAYASRGDSLLELTPNGVHQAREAGRRLQDLLQDDRIFVCVSPFERTQQTLLALYHGSNLEANVVRVHVDSRIREQEFGNFQTPGLSATVRAEEKLVGRFYYRRPNAESSADVFDRVSQFWDCLLSTGNDALLVGSEAADCCLVVTHGLTIRLLLMKIFHWSVETYETVWNMGNCHHITLRKNADSRCYQICPEESFPPRIPWATREIWLVMKDQRASYDTERRLKELEDFQASAQGNRLARTVSGPLEEKEKNCGGGPSTPDLIRALSAAQVVEIRGIWPEIDRAIDGLRAQRMRERSKPYTVVDYISMPQPRTTNSKALMGRLVPEHGLHGRFSPEELDKKALLHRKDVNLEQVERVDWWGDSISHQAKTLRWQTMKHMTSGDAMSPRLPPRFHRAAAARMDSIAFAVPGDTESRRPSISKEHCPSTSRSVGAAAGEKWDFFPTDNPWGDEHPEHSFGEASASMGLI
mmetsp:Transcript_52573/g.97334  ORF Transcript_52573/g.97334 Transcript_52573/m.97334 type:complete len:563 (-) Transcript_52573:28-1716(-)